MNVGMAGLGGMGRPLAECMPNAGFAHTVTDLREEPVKDLVSLGARTAGAPREAARGVAEKECRALMKHFEELAGVRVRPPGRWRGGPARNRLRR